MFDLIPPQLRIVAIGLGAALLFGAGCLSGWKANGVVLNAELDRQARVHSDTLAEIARVAARQVQDQQEKRQQLETQLAGIDQQRYQELQHAQTITDTLIADLAAARKRLSVRITHPACGRAVSTSAGATGMDDGTDRADIHPEDAAAIARITGDANRCAVKLGALQAWVRSSGAAK